MSMLSLPPHPLAASILAAGALTLGVSVGAARADTVYLANGRSFEDVVARVEGDRVLIRFDYGEMGVPRSSVTRIDTGSSELARFEERWRALAAAGATADEWLELARWARAGGLDHGAGRAALRASAQDPDLEGLAPLLGALGFVREEESGAWLPADEAMVRRGWVRRGAGWISPEAAAAERGALERAAAERRVAEREERMLQAMELLTIARLAEELEPPPRVGLPIYPVVVIPGKGGHHRDRFGGRPGIPADRETWDDLLHRNPGSLLPVGPDRPGRNPGSLLPVEPGRSHRGSVKEQEPDS